MNTRTQLLPSSLSSAVTRPEPGYAPRPCSWRDAVPVLTGEHCVLRELQEDDAPPLVSILTAPDVARFMSPPPTTVERFARFIEWSHREREAGRYLAFALVPHAHVVAGRPAAAPSARARVPRRPSGAWRWPPRYRGAGLFLDAARLLLDFAFNELGVHRLEARAALANGRSQAAMRKLGAVQEGVLRQSLTTADGQRLDQVLWSLLDEDWRQLDRQPDVLLVH